MERTFRFISLLIATIATLPALSQINSNLHKKKIAASGVVRLDSLSIVPHTVIIPQYDTSYYTIDPVNAKLQWKKQADQDSVDVLYRTFPTRLNAIAKRFTYDSIMNNFIPQSAVTRNGNKNDNAIFNFGNLNYNGSFGRNVSFGNSQDAVFNSQFNLQLSGYIGDSIQIAAAITDNNIPIQPDGSTQQLNEFDKVLLQFKKKGWEIDLGDIDLRQNQLYFLNFYKRLQGISYQQKFNINKNTVNKTVVSGAIAKGVFARNILAVQEGNQGPYPLQGNNNEAYFVVLSGTEKVYINGVVMQRGEDQDYTINYNTAQITFTPKQMITSDSRIQVEFEYADRNYLNSMLYASNETDFGKRLKLTVAVYNNADAKNSPIDQPLTTDQMQFLANLGDSAQNAYYPGGVIDTFSSSAIMYKKIDTAYNGRHDSIYVYSTSPDSARYNLSFISVGQGKGNYVPLYNAANGSVYQWVQPVNGVPQGSYEAATFLVTPKKQQLISVGAEYQLNKSTMVKAELATSNYNANTFSTLQKNNDVGYAGKFSIINNEKWKAKNSKTYYLTTNVGYEHVDQNFKSIEQLRPVEFARDWGLQISPTPATEDLSSFGIKLNDEKNNSLEYKFGSYVRSDGFKGFQNIIDHSQEFGGWKLKDGISLTTLDTPSAKGYYLKPNIDLSRTFSSFHHYTIGASYALERNEMKNNATDTISAISYAFETASAYIRSDQTKKDRWSFTYFTRTDQMPYQKELKTADRSNNYNFQADLLSNKHQQLRVNVTYRQLFVPDTAITTQRPDNSLLGRAEYLVNEWNGLVTGNALYELGAGQEQERSYTYIQVPAGQGQYTWIDHNNDGIQQLNEFVVAQFPDQATYVRVFTPTGNYIKADYTQLNYSVSINPKAIANSIHNKYWKSFLTKWQMVSSLQTNKKQIAAGNPVFNPFKGNIADTSLISLSYVFSNTLSFNRTSTSWGADISNLVNNNKSILTYGLQSQETNTWTLHGRLNIAKAYTLEMIQKFGSNSLITPAFSNQNYAISLFSSQPQITYTGGSKFRLQTSYEYERKANAALYGGDKAISNSLNVEGKYNAVTNTSITAKFTLNSISYTGAANTTVSYIMLNGLLPGKNYLWGLNFTKRLINNLEISFQYEGRKPGDGPTINTGTASIRALL